MNLKRVLRCFLLLSTMEFSAEATISNYVPPLLPNAEWVERIEAYGCSARTFRAFQPQSHADLLEALMVYADADCQGPEWLLDEREILGRSYLQSEARAFALLSSNSPLVLLGQSAQIDPLFSMREGRRLFSGPQIYGELNLNSQMVTGGEWGLALSVTPGFALAHQNRSDMVGKFYFQDGYIKGGYRRTELVVGRVSERFGEAENGNLILSGAHQPLDMIKFAVRPHWIRPLSFLGPITFQTWLASDNSAIGRKEAQLWGFQLGMRPLTFFEWGFLNLMQFGGHGSPSLDFGDYLAMLAGSQNEELKLKRHQSYALHLGFWGPRQQVKVYHQLLFNSLGRLENWFSEDISWLVGIWLPKLGEGDLRLEWVRTQPSAYSDGRWTQGWSVGGTPLGHPIGNDGQALYLDWGLFTVKKWRPELGLSYEIRNQSGRLNGLKSETRWGIALSGSKRFQAIELDLQVKAQRIVQRNYLASPAEWEAGAFTFLRYSFL